LHRHLGEECWRRRQALLQLNTSHHVFVSKGTVFATRGARDLRQCGDGTEFHSELHRKLPDRE